MIYQYGAYIFAFFAVLGFIAFGMLVAWGLCRINFGELKE
jgi:hypothetical protein